MFNAAADFVGGAIDGMREALSSPRRGADGTPVGSQGQSQRERGASGVGGNNDFQRDG